MPLKPGEDDLDSCTRQVEFSQYEGKVVLVVNVASECGYTAGHYTGLKRLQDILRYNNKLEILGKFNESNFSLKYYFLFAAFPCNQFGGQEPGDAAQIREVVFSQYGAKFTVFQKVEVFGPKSSPVWKYLTDNSGVVPEWNFYKYLLDHHGNIIQVWPPQTPVEDIFEAVQRAVQDADGEVQVESPLGSHDEL